MKAGYMKNMSDWNHNLKWLQTSSYFVTFSAKKIQPQQKLSRLKSAYALTWLNYWNKLIPTSLLILNIKKR